MTNLIAALLFTVTTNWTTIGTYYPVKGEHHWEVQQGQLQTNVTAVMVWKGQRHEVALESIPGPVIGKRRVEKEGGQPIRFELPKPYVTCPSISPRPSIVVTNWPHGWIVSNQLYRIEL